MEGLLSVPKPRINNQITAAELRVIGENGDNLGVLSRDEAMKLARPDEGIDLIEISATATPPVARIMSYDKYRYEEEKRIKKERVAQKSVGVKQVQISVRAADNDLLLKARQVEKFFAEGHPVDINIRLRGREKYNRPWVHERLEIFLKMIPVEFKRMGELRFGGRGASMQIQQK